VSPSILVRFNEVEPSNMVPKKRLHQASSIIDIAKQSPSLAHLKRMRLVSEHTMQVYFSFLSWHLSWKNG